MSQWSFLHTPQAYESPLPIPAEGIFDSPTVVVCLNSTWAGIVSGLLEQLLTPAIWKGTEAQADAAQQEVHKLLIALSDVRVCP